jgi:hypothetical protein
MDPIVINAVAFQADGMWIAQCLEYNFVSCAATRDELPGALMRQVLGQIELDLEDGHEPFFEFKPAPAKYWQLFEEAKRQSAPIRKWSESPEHTRVETQLFPVAA